MLDDIKAYKHYERQREFLNLVSHVGSISVEV